MRLFGLGREGGGIFGLVSPRFIRYVVVGVLNTLLFFALVNLLGAFFDVYAGIAFMVISAFSTAVVIVHSYAWNSRWVFRARGGAWQFFKFVLVNGGAVALNAGVVYVVTTLIPPAPQLAAFEDLAEVVWANFAEALSIVAIIAWNYCGFRFFVFRDRSAAMRDGIGAALPGVSQTPVRPVFPMLVAACSLIVGLLHVGPLWAIAEYLETNDGQPFVFSYENYRNDLTYLARAREVYDGHSPSSDPFADDSPTTLRNPIPSLVFAAFLVPAEGKIYPAYLAALFVFSQVNFLLFFLVGKKLFHRNLWALAFALVAALTPIPLRMLNFYGTA
ncbi:GtrA family protein [Candidatus Parcubacteria bacterium]|nr:MAG: GtrA family protein [Candidatus Parcubacteria bacterium]